MSTVASHPVHGAADAVQPPPDLFQAIARRFDSSRSAAAFVTTAVREVSERFGAAYAIARINTGAQVLDEEWAGAADDGRFWRQALSTALTESISLMESRARLYGPAGAEQRIAVLATPLRLGVEGFGGVAMAVGCRGGAEAHARLSELRAAMALIGTLAPAVERGTKAAPSSGGSDSARTEVDALASSASMRTVHELAFTIVSALRTRLGCEQAALGLVRRGGVVVEAVSGVDEVVKRSPGVAAIRAAMEECLDAGRVLACNDRKDAGNRLLSAWQAASHGAAVATIPIRDRDRVAAIVGLRHRPGERFDPEQLERIGAAAAPYGPALRLVHRASRGVVAHACASATSLIRRQLDPRSPVRASLSIATIGLAAWLAFGTLPMRVTGRATVAPSMVLNISAPFSGVLERVHVARGDQVVAGQLLCEFDTTPLEVEIAGVQADLESTHLRLDSARVAGNQSEAMAASIELEAFDVRLGILQQQVDMARVVAPRAGTIVAEDLRTLVGDTLLIGTRMLQLAPYEGLVLEIEVPESAAAEVTESMPGSFASHARPDVQEPFVIDRIRPQAEIREGRRVLVADAKVNEGFAWVRPGMTGVARIDAGTERAWWVVSRRLVNKVRLWLWI